MKLLPETLAHKRPQKFPIEDQLELPNLPPPMTENRAKELYSSHQDKMAYDPLGR